MAATTPAPPQDAALDPELRRIALAVVTGAVAVILDTTIVSVALHDLGRALDASVETIQWVSTAYLLAMFVPLRADHLADNSGHILLRTIFLGIPPHGNQGQFSRQAASRSEVR